MNQEAVLQVHQTVPKSIGQKINFYVGFKRIFDVIISLIGMLFILPIALVVKIASIITKDKGSIFYKQKRVGKDGKFIYIYKFRTMCTNASEVLDELLKDEKYKKEWEENQKIKDDPRITKIGKFLRETSLDEVPQFINVLKGDMSLIGPRPLVEGELEKHNGNHRLYESIRPGITSWWAANGRSDIDYKKRLELENYYVKNMSLRLDIKCIVRTIAVVLKRNGAK